MHDSRNPGSFKTSPLSNACLLSLLSFLNMASAPQLVLLDRYLLALFLLFRRCWGHPGCSRITHTHTRARARAHKHTHTLENILVGHEVYRADIACVGLGGKSFHLGWIRCLGVSCTCTEPIYLILASVACGKSITFVRVDIFLLITFNYLRACGYFSRYVRACVVACIYARTRTCACAYVCVRDRVCLCVNARMCACVHVCMCVRANSRGTSGLAATRLPARCATDKRFFGFIASFFTVTLLASVCVCVCVCARARVCV